MKKLFAILLILLSGCVTRSQYLRDRLQDSQDKQEQRKFNAEVLRRMEAFNAPSDCEVYIASDSEKMIFKGVSFKYKRSLSAEIEAEHDQWSTFLYEQLKGFIRAEHDRIDALEKKMDESPKSWKCVYTSTSIVCVPSNAYYRVWENWPEDLWTTDKKRPNWPCFRCGEEKK